MAENVKIIYAPKERRSPSAKREVSRRWQRQWQWASGSGPAAAGQRQRAMLREPDAGSYYLVHADDV